MDDHHLPYLQLILWSLPKWSMNPNLWSNLTRAWRCGIAMTFNAFDENVVLILGAAATAVLCSAFTTSIFFVMDQRIDVNSFKLFGSFRGVAYANNPYRFHIF